MSAFSLIGDYEYSGCRIDDVAYSIIRNGGVIERIRRIGQTDNPIVWQRGDMPSELFFRVIGAEIRWRAYPKNDDAKSAEPHP